jgi:hypothetical protein
MKVRDAQQIAKRVLCLSAIVTRTKAEFALHMSEGGVPNSRQLEEASYALSIEPWLKKEGLWEAASPGEKRLLQKKLGTWNEQEIADGQWREEALMVLHWSVSPSAKMPAYDQMAADSEIMNGVPNPKDSQKFISDSKLRPLNDITKARDIAELWLWRSRTTQIMNDGVRPPKGTTFGKIISLTVAKAAQDGLFRPIDGDFPAFGKPFSKLTDDEWSTMNSISTERLYGLNWTCGYSDDWDNVSVGT